MKWIVIAVGALVALLGLAADRAADTAGERWRQRMRGFEMTITVAEDRPPERLVTRIVAPEDAPFGGRWVYTLALLEGGTDRMIMRYLRALGRRFGEDVDPT